MSLFRAIAVLGSTCLTAAPAVAMADLPRPAASEAQLLAMQHGIDYGAITGRVDSLVATGDKAGLSLNGPEAAPAGSLASYVANAPKVADVSAPERPVPLADQTADDAATPSAGLVSATCDAYFLQSQALIDNLRVAVQAMAAKDAAAEAAILPKLQVQFSAQAPFEIVAETCDGDHVNAYTTLQYTELKTKEALGLDTGFPAGQVIIKQPDLNQSVLPYAVGWIKYEQQDYKGALAAYGKGLAMYPHDHALQQEYIATLLKLERPGDMVNFIEASLNSTFDYDDTARAKMFAERGIGLLMVGYFEAAEESLGLSLSYNYDEDVAKVLTSLQAALAGAKN